jgi:hypothetical protein
MRCHNHDYQINARGIEAQMLGWFYAIRNNLLQERVRQLVRVQVGHTCGLKVPCQTNSSVALPRSNIERTLLAGAMHHKNRSSESEHSGRCGA